MTPAEGPLPGSFRDPDGFVFRRSGVLYRLVRESARDDYEALTGSGLYETLAARGDLVRHEELPPEPGAWRILRPEPVPFISYPYEWCFSQLKEAALLTLGIEAEALAHGMTLKDASAYNVQFRGATPVFIDTLSFTRYRAETPWIAYRQFCQHFLAPLALMAHRDPRLGTLSRVHLDGVPLDLASRLLPWRTRLNPGLLAHLHLHARSQKTHADRPVDAGSLRMPEASRRALVTHLATTIRGLKVPRDKTEWGGYYDDNSYSPAALAGKAEIVRGMLSTIAPRTAWDLGANNGMFSRLAAEMGIPTVAFDLDHAAVEAGHQSEHRGGEHGTGGKNLLHLVMDLTNPSPGTGWAHEERTSLAGRGPVDVVMALALIHHLALSNHLPFGKIADFFAALGRHLILEFVPKTDPQVQRLLASRGDSFPDYTETEMVRAFSTRFRLVEAREIPESGRKLFRMEKIPS